MNGPGPRSLLRRWFPYGTADDARVRLLCLPHAGAGASTFLPWREQLGPAIGVCPVQLPGRETRLSERPYRRLRDLVPQLLPAILPLADRPLALFGHSMGALIVFELARSMRAAGMPLPTHLYVSGRTAPQIRDSHTVMFELSDAELLAELRVLGGTPREVLDDPTVMAKFLPFLRGDLELNENYSFAEEPPMPVPLTVFGGEADPRAAPEELAAWSVVTASRFEVRMLPGDHFAVFQRADVVLKHMRSGLADDWRLSDAQSRGRTEAIR
jgi:medium-chain acyl-[acyl-carrier-protein] hydrolase